MAVRRALVSIRLRLADAAEVALGRREQLTPPRRLRGLVGNSDFRATGEEFGKHLRELAGLKASDRVLDIGCGAGRLARVLAGELRPPGSYDGFDVSAEAVAWCQRHYRGTAAAFRFEHADLYNGMYNRSSTGVATEYRFPYRDGSFDLIIATSVFTHLLADAADHYLAEVARVLAPGGRFFSTWFLLEPNQPGDHPPMIDFQQTGGPTATIDVALPEAALAYDAAWLRRQFAQQGLRLREPIVWGTWSGRPGRSSQDIAVAQLD